jgi:serine/threonine-protein kinase RsbT
METIEIRNNEDIVRARQAARMTAEKLGFSVVNKTRIATAVSELARNVFIHGGGGRMEIEKIKKSGKSGIRCTFIDEGPGIPNVEEAMRHGFSTRNGLGHGLPGSKRLMDDFRIESEVGKGTRVEVTKWK